MIVPIQYQIKNNPKYVKYLREHSYWYKELNRHPDNFKAFEEEVKTVYQLRPADRISKMLDTMDMVGTILSTLKG